jgi:hypothetical protein
MRRLYLVLASAVIATTLIVVAAGASAAPASEDFLALAYSRSLHEADSLGNYVRASFGGHATTLGRAKHLALNECVKAGGAAGHDANGAPVYQDDCKGLAWVRDGFLALAIEDMRVKSPQGYEPKYGWATDRKYARAKGRALDSCYAAEPLLNADCKISFVGSTDGAHDRQSNFDGGPWNTPTVPPPH